MSSSHDDHSARCDELLGLAAECALFGGDLAREDIERARALGIDLEHEALIYELAAAEIAVAEAMRCGLAEPPKVLAERLARSARGGAPIAGRVAPSRAREFLAAAAGIAFGAIATALIMQAGSGTDDLEKPTDPVRFVASHPNAVHWPWSATRDPLVVGTVRGEAYFDPETDEGLLEIEGLAANDPRREQYQLWIFDAERDERFPVDGGVFDIPEGGRACVPIRARLGVTRPVMFAVTVERPGGAVVSERRIALIARP